MSSKVMITGAGGQLGRDLAIHLHAAGHEVHAFDRNRLDITDADRVQASVWKLRPDAIVHAAAYTSVDDAEAHPDLAYHVNALGTRNLAIAAEDVRAKLVYISTDYVFDGQKRTPYTEYDTPHPINQYGRSKLAGEEFVRSFSRSWYIVRVSWLYGPFGSNFVKTMLRLASEGKDLQVVNDQHGTPTYTVDVARFISSLIATSYYGIYHATNRGHCTWYDFAREIFAIKGLDVPIEPVPTEHHPRPAQRPAYSVLDHMNLRLERFTPMRHWRDALKDYLREHG